MFANESLVRYVVEVYPDGYTIAQLIINILVGFLAFYAIIQTNKSISSSEKSRKISNMPLISLGEYRRKQPIILDESILNRFFENNNDFIFLKNSGLIPAYNAKLMFTIYPFEFSDPEIKRVFIDGEWKSTLLEYLNNDGSYSFEVNKGILNSDEKIDIIDTEFNTMFTYLLEYGTSNISIGGFVQEIFGKVSASWLDYYENEFKIETNVKFMITSTRIDEFGNFNNESINDSSSFLKIEFIHPKITNPYY